MDKEMELDLNSPFLYDPSLVLYLPLHKMDGATIRDESAYGLSCTNSGSLWTPQGRLFNGTNNLVTIPDSVALSALSALTVEAWIKQDTLATKGVISKDSDGADREWPFLVVSDGSFILAGYSQVLSGFNYLEGQTAASLIIAGVWQHIVGTWNGVNATGNIKLYLNGVSKALSQSDTKLGTGWAPWDSANPVEIGRYAGEGTFCFNGIIGEARIYNRALSASEVMNNYLTTKWRYQ